VEEKETDAVIAEIKKERERRTNQKDFVVSDETVRQLGEFVSVADLRAKVAEELMTRKKNKAAEKRRAKLLDALTEGTTGEMPEAIVEHELDRFEAELEGQLKAAGASLEQYLKEIKKDRALVRTEWRPDAARRARLELALVEIARAENIHAPKEEVDAEIREILKRHRDARPEIARQFVENMILNRKVIQFLENQK
jgi:trigger factor